MNLLPRQTELTNFQFALLLTIPTVSFLAAVILYPLLYALWLSFHSTILLGGIQVNWVGWENYLDLIQSEAFYHSTVISLRFTLESVVFTLLIALGAALTLAQFPEWGWVRALVILPWAASRYSTAILFKYMFKGRISFFTSVAHALGFDQVVNFMDQHTVVETLALGNAWHLAPLVTFFFLANIEAIPSNLYRLAEMDHFGPLRKFYYVTYPYLRYSIFVFTAVVTVLSLKVFDFIFVQSGGGPGSASATLTYRIYVESFKNFRLGYGSAMSFLLLLIMLVLTFGYFLVYGRKIEL